MQMQSTKQHMILAAVFAGGFGLINMWVSDAALVTTLVQFPLFFGVMFVTMRGTNRITVMMTKRFRKEPPVPEVLAPPEPTSERPEHAQRRRSRRRRRGRGRRV